MRKSRARGEVDQFFKDTVQSKLCGCESGLHDDKAQALRERMRLQRRYGAVAMTIPCMMLLKPRTLMS